MSDSAQNVSADEPTKPTLLEQLAARFFHDKRMLVLLLALIAVGGMSSLSIMPRMEDPVLTPRFALVVTRMPGADAQRVESLVTEKIESSLREVEEINEISSVSRVGISIISIELRDSVYETDGVWSEVRGKIEDSIPDLPPEATRPVFDELKVRAYSLIAGLAWDRDEPADYRLLRRLATDLQDRLQNLAGTEVVERFGDPGEEIEVRIDPVRAAALGLNPQQIAGLVASYDAKGTAGQLREQSLSMLIEVGNQLDAIRQISNIPVAAADGRDVRLGQIGNVSLDVPNPLSRAVLMNGREAVALGAMVRVDTRIDNWTVAVNELLDEYAQTLPAGVMIDRLMVQNEYVESRLQDLSWNLILGALAVATVIFLMMGWRSAIIVTLTLPLASLMVLFCMNVYGVPIHQMSVTGLIIAFGLLIDNAIVVVDEVKGRLREGSTAVEAMTGSVSHLAVPLLGSTLTTAFAFAPIALMPGPAGEFVGSIAISVIFAIFSSLFLAVTIIPTIASRLVAGRFDIDQTEQQSKNWFTRLIHDGIQFPAMERVYERGIGVCLKHPIIGIAVALVLPVSGFVTSATLKEQFFPPTDRNQFHIQVDLPIAASIEETQAVAARIDPFVRKMGAERIDWFFGDSAPEFYYNVTADRKGQPSFCQAIVTLPDGTDPKPIIRKLQTTLDENLFAARIVVRQLEQGPPFEAPIEIRVFGPNLDTLRQIGHQIRERLNNLPEVVAVRTDLSEVLPQLSFEVDESIAAQADITPAEIGQQLATTLEGAYGGNVLQDNEELPVIVRVGDSDRASLARIEGLDILLPGGLTTPVRAISEIDLVPEAASIPRINRERINEVSAYLVSGVLPSSVQSQFEESLISDPLDLPSGYRLGFGGETAERDESVGNLFSTVGILGVMMVATLVLSFGSFRMASIIGIVGMLSVGLALLSLVVSGYPFGFMAIIGTMGLVGVAINDSIVVLAGIRTNPQACVGDVAAATHEVMHATRHVVSTTITTMAGFAPLIIAGGAFWPPLAVAISGGVLGGSLLALVLVPSLHQLLLARPAGNDQAGTV